ncbi:MAG: isocyanide synthase family protein [Pseudoruegeria sp.]
MNRVNDRAFLPLDDEFLDTTETGLLIFQELYKRYNPLDPEKRISKVAAEHHLEQIQTMMDAGLPIKMVLPAFPGKSPNRRKALSSMPDLAEYLALKELAEMCRAIQKIYAPGAIIEICSDGYVFSDLVYIPDTHVKEYTDELKRRTSAVHPGFFRYFDLKNAYPHLGGIAEMRDRLTEEYAEPLEELVARIREDEDAQSMYRGITRFLFEDYKGLADFADYSNSRIQKDARKAAYRLIQQSNAWSALLKKRSPGSLRLSIHPQSPNSLKFGIKIVSCLDIWRTPWHSVALKRDGQIVLERRSEVEANGCRLMFRDGRPCHYVMN